jgi:hypothetical protein
LNHDTTPRISPPSRRRRRRPVRGHGPDVVDDLALEGQDQVLSKIDRQTNGLSERERQDIADRAAAAAIAAYRSQSGV